MPKAEFWIARPTHYWMLDSKFDGSFNFGKIYEDAGLDGLLFLIHKISHLRFIQV